MPAAIVRGADRRDVPALLRMAHDFLEASPLPLPWSEHWVEGRFLAAIANRDDQLVCVLEVDGSVRGMICAQLGYSPFAPVKIATELAVWIDPGARGSVRNLIRLVCELEVWAAGRGCAYSGLMSLGDSRFDSVLERLGYTPIERHYLKEL